jgi:hypothetical protein
MLIHSGNEKKMFTNITVNVFVPKDPNIIGPSFDLVDDLDDDPEAFSQFQYFVRFLKSHYDSAKYQITQQQKPC